MHSLVVTFADAADWSAPAPGSGPWRRYRVRTLAGDLAPAGYPFLLIGRAAESPVAGPADRWAAWRCVPVPGQAAPVLADHLYLTFSSIPAGVSEDAYVDWYGSHLQENLAVPGFRRGWRFRTEPAGPPTHAVPTGRHLAMYEIEGDWSELRRALDAVAPGKRARWPEWFARRQRVSFEATAL
jgi:hypothetical protein